MATPEIRPNPIPRVYPTENAVDSTLYGLAFGANNQIQKRIADLENYISDLVNKAEKLINKSLDQVEADIIAAAARNGIANVEVTITYVDGQVANFETNIYNLVDLLIKKIRAAVEALKEKIETETQASIAAGVVRSAIARIERLIEETITAVKQLLNRTKTRVESIIHAADAKARTLHTTSEGIALLGRAKAAIDNSILIAENQVNERIWAAYKRVRSESQPLTALLHSLV